MGGNIQGNTIVPPADSQGYIKYNSAQSLKVDEALFTEADLFKVDGGLSAGASAGPGGGCNISFDSFLDIDFSLPEFSFDFMGSDFDTSLFDKADAISLEFTMINEMLINTILDMGCCDIAKVYNVTMVPFFQFFADSNGGGFIKMIVTYAEIITAMRALIEPLECLIRWVPGNPWFPRDFDYLAWIYGYFKESKPFMDRILSGEMLDIVLNPVHNIRQKMQACLTSGIPTGTTFEEFMEIGDPRSMAAISNLAARDGKIVKEAVMPVIVKPHKPTPGDYKGGSSNGEYITDLANYEKAKVIYDVRIKNRATAEAEIKAQSVAHQAMNRNLAVTAQTGLVVHAHTDGLCGCIADAMGLNNLSIELIPIRTTADMYKLEGKTIAGCTNKTCGTISKDNAKEDNITVEKKHIASPKTQAAICDSGTSKGKCKKIETTTTTVIKKSEYVKIDAVSNEQIRCKVKVIKQAATLASDQNAIRGENDKSQDTLDKIIKEADALTVEINNNYIVYKKSWDKRRAALLLELIKATHLNTKANISDRISTLNQSKRAMELTVAQNIYTSYYGTFSPVDMVNDPKDRRAISNYLTQGQLLSLFPAEYDTINMELTTLNMEKYGPEVALTPFPPNTPPQNIIITLPVSKEVDTDPRFLVNYFDAGFVKEKGTSNWRNFNKLNLLWNEFSRERGAISADKSDMYFKAIFPTDSIGDKACLEHARKNYIQKEALRLFIEGELDINKEVNVDGLCNLIFEKYGFDANEDIMTFDDDEIHIIIDEISIWNEYKLGKLWIKTRVSDPSLKFNAEYEYSQEGTEEFSISVNGRNIDAVVRNDGGGIATQAKESVNASIKERAPYYSKNIQLETSKQYLHQGIDACRSAILNSIASMVPTEIPLIIPCTCDNFLCMLLNMIIQYVMAALNRLIKELIAMIIQFLIPDWVKDLLRTIQDFLKCLGSVFGIVNTIQEIHEYTEDLLESMKDRIRYYPADACFIPEDPFPEVPVQMPGDTYTGDDDNWGDDDPGDNGDDDGGTYLPPGGPGGPGDGYGPGGPGGPGDGYGPGGPNNPRGCLNPPVILSDAVGMVPGITGRCIPGLQFKCDYLDI